ncbi:hypothetical protein NUACC21_48590 [Scytonema sp. NUACC21]
MARDLINGKPPYTETWDNKPIGIYLFYALGLILFGNSVVSIAIVACIAVSISCWLLYKLGSIFGQGNDIGLLAGIFYAVFSVGTDELAANTELFFIPFTLFSFHQLFLLKNSERAIRQNFLRLLAIGLSMGIALTIKQVIIFEFIGILILTFIILRFSEPNSYKYTLKKIFQGYIILLLGFIIPFVLVSGYFWFSGYFQEYIYANFTANLLRISDAKLTIVSLGSGLLMQIKRNLFLGLGLFLTILYYQRNRSRETKLLLYMFLWVFMAFLGVASPKSFYSHYFLQLLPPLCLLTAYLIKNTVLTANVINKINKFIILSLILGFPIFHSLYPTMKLGGKYIYFRYVRGVENWGNTPASIAKYLEQRVSSKDYIYVFDYYAVVYCLVPAKVPTKYAFPLFLTSYLSNIAGINPLEELDNIMAKKPVYVIKTKQQVQGWDLSMKLDNYLKDYYLEKTFVDMEREIPEVQSQEIELYKLKR